jgi:hypothetical protein
MLVANNLIPIRLWLFRYGTRSGIGQVCKQTWRNQQAQVNTLRNQWPIPIPDGKGKIPPKFLGNSGRSGCVQKSPYISQMWDVIEITLSSNETLDIIFLILIRFLFSSFVTLKLEWILILSCCWIISYFLLLLVFSSVDGARQAGSVRQWAYWPSRMKSL